ncbi:hypothetical protein V6N13_104344 [Hibiscus sabdariffa]
MNTFRNKQTNTNITLFVQARFIYTPSDLKASLSKVGKNNFVKPNSSKPNYVKRNFKDYKQRSFHKTFKGKRIRSVWVPKELTTSKNISAIATWIPKGTKVLGANNHGPKMSLTSKTYRVFNNRTLVVKESIHVVFDDNLFPRKDSCDDNDDVGILKVNGGEQSSKVDEMSSKEEAQDPPLEALKDMSLEEREVSYPRELNYVKGGEILGDPSKGVTTGSSLRNTCNYVAFIS